MVSSDRGFTWLKSRLEPGAEVPGCCTAIARVIPMSLTLLDDPSLAEPLPMRFTAAGGAQPDPPDAASESSSGGSDGSNAPPAAAEPVRRSDRQQGVPGQAYEGSAEAEAQELGPAARTRRQGGASGAAN